MGFSFVTEIPSPDVIRERFPLAPELAARKKERDEEIKKIITGESDKLLVVVGPCSADNEEAVVDYVSRLVKVQGRYWLPVLPLVLALVHHNRTFAVQKPAERKAVFAMLCLTSFVILQGAGLYATFQMPS